MRQIRTKFEGVAIATVSPTDGRYLSRVIVQASHDKALAIASALQNIDEVRATPVVRDFDVFGRMYWTNRLSDHD